MLRRLFPQIALQLYPVRHELLLLLRRVYCIRGYLGRMSRCKEAPALVILSLDTMSQRQNQYGYVPTTPGSEWLQGDYGMGRAFMTPGSIPPA